MKTVIVGGGISGLAAAYFLNRRQPSRQVIVLESSPLWGGIIRTEHRDGFCLEAGPDAIVRSKKQAAELCAELGLRSQLIGNRLENQRSYTWFRGELQPLPRVLNPPIDLQELLDSPLLSEQGRLKASREPEMPRSSGQDASVADFIRRRFGSEVVERVFDPLVAGVFGGSASQISLPAAFPRLLEYEQLHGRLTSDAGRTAPKLRSRSIFQSLRQGMGQLTDKLADSLRGRAELRLGSPVSAVRSGQGGFVVQLLDGSSIGTESLALATSAPTSARLLRQDWRPIAEMLDRIEYAPSILVCLGYRQEVADRPGSGWIVPPACGKNLLACTWAHRKFPGRCPQGGSLLRAYLAGSAAARLMSSTDREIVAVVRGELQEIQGVEAEPVLQSVHRLPRALPLYKLGHLQLTAQLEEALTDAPGLFCIGNYLDGVGISDCIRHAEKVSLQLEGPEEGRG